MPDRVVCISDTWVVCRPGIPPSKPGHPVKDEIYTVSTVYTPPETRDGKTYYHLREFPEALYQVICFRPVDDTFGGLVEEIISKQVQVEEIEKISL